MGNVADPIKNMNPLSLAFMGDAVYEQYVRKRVLEKSSASPDVLHRHAVSYVKAKAQAAAVKAIFEKLSEDEQQIVKRARNHKISTKAKNASASDYKWATGFEALIGYLWLSDKNERLDEIVKLCFEFTEREG